MNKVSTLKTNNVLIQFTNKKSVIFSLFLMATLLMGTSVNMNMFSMAMASEKD